MSNPLEVTNPGVVNVANEGYDGLPAEVPSFKQVPASAAVDNERGEVSQVDPLSVDQPVTKQVPASIALLNIDGGASSEKPISVDQPVTVSVPGEPLLLVQAGSDSQVKKSITVQQNSAVNVVNQTYGNGQVANVFI